MNRDETVEIIKELLQNCPKLEDVYLCMIPPTGSTPIVSQGYQVHIKKTHPFDEETEKCIKAIAEKHKLCVQQEAGEKMIIYRQPS